MSPDPYSRWESVEGLKVELAKSGDFVDLSIATTRSHWTLDLETFDTGRSFSLKEFVEL